MKNVNIDNLKISRLRFRLFMWNVKGDSPTVLILLNESRAQWNREKDFCAGNSSELFLILWILLIFQIHKTHLSSFMSLRNEKKNIITS